MSKYIATRAIRGANALVMEAELLLKKALKEKGPDTPVSFPNTAYYLPLILGMTGTEVTKLGDLQPVIEHARGLLHPQPAQRHWTPYLGETLDSGMATLLAAEAIEAVRFVYGLQPEPMPGLELAGSTSYENSDYDHPVADGHLNGPIDDIQLRSWGIQLVDGRMPGFAAIVGCAKSNEVAVQIVRELQKRNILTFLSGNVNGRSIIHQLMEEGVELGYDTYTVPFGTDTISAIYALGFATRSALTFGGLKPGQARDILLYNRERVFAFVLALGEVDDLKYAAAAGAINFGFPVIADTVIPEILPTGVTTYEHVVSMPWNEIPGKNDVEKAERLVQKCIEVRGVKIKVHDVPVPVPYGSAFEGEVVRKNDMRVEFGGKYSRCFEYLRMVPLDSIADGVVEVVGPDFSEIELRGSMDMGIVVEVAGRKMQEDFEPVLERQIHYFINGASGIQHIGQRDIAWIRISKAAADKGFDLKHFGAILHARFHADFGAIVDKVKVTIYTDPDKVAEWLEKARKAYDYRNRRLADLTDDAVEEFYSCTLCQSFAPNHVCIVSPERLGLCGAYNWLDCKASYNINPTGPNQPIRLGKVMDPQKGYWEGTISYARIGSHGVVEKVAMYSIMENPMTACGCFECIVMVIPEVNGVMVVSREDTGMTPAGMKFSTLAGMAGGGIQTPGVMGVGKYYLISPKFISADGGFKRIVWMSSVLKETMADELRAAAEREGIPDLVDRIATGDDLTEVDDLIKWVEEKQHPVLTMPPIGLTTEEDETSPAEAEAAPELDIEFDVLAQAEAVVAAAEDKKQTAAPTITVAREASPPAPVKSDNTHHEHTEPAMTEKQQTPPTPPPEPTPDSGFLPEGSDPLLEAEQAALRQAEALQKAQEEALRQAKALRRAREAGWGAGAGSPEQAIAQLRQALMAALAALGGIEPGGLPQTAAPPAAAPPAPSATQQPAPAAEAAPPPAAEEEAALAEPQAAVAPAPAAPAAPAIIKSPPPIKPWLPAEMKTPLLTEKWSGQVREITLGATAAEGGTRTRTVTVGGHTAMPFLTFDGDIPHAPVIALEIADRRPDGWSPLLYEQWSNVIDDPAAWAQAAEQAGAELLLLRLSLTDSEGQPNTPERAVKITKDVLAATGLPLLVYGPGQVNLDNELLVPVSEACKGERLVLGICEDKNYRTIVATAMANDHLVTARTAMDVNLAKQLNILITDMGLPLERILMDPTTGALGYGFEYGYSVMERLRLAALQGDAMTQLPMIVTPGEECWKAKESKVGAGVPEAWGDWLERAITWETLTASMLIESGADIIVLRHPESLKRTRWAIEDLTRNT